jgi:hypothetical protein
METAETDTGEQLQSYGHSSVTKFFELPSDTVGTAYKLVFIYTGYMFRLLQSLLSS